MKPVDIYVRVSRVGGREHLISPEQQEQRARALITERGLVAGKVLIDLDESGGKFDRPGLLEALQRVKEGESGGLVVAWLDRFSRDSEHAHRLLRDLHETGGTLYAPDAPSDWTTPEGELQAGVLFAFAQYVRGRAKESFRKSKERAIAAGIPVQSHAPVGYRKRADRRLEPNPVTAPIIRELFERRATGYSLEALALFLEERGVETSRGAKTWLGPSVAYVLQSRVYLGELSNGKLNPFVNRDAHLPIVDLATWTAAQRPPTRTRPTNRGTYLLSGLLRCQACGYSMRGTTYPDGRRVYRCKRRQAGGVCSRPGWVRADIVDPIAERLLLGMEATATEIESADGLQEALDIARRRLEQAMSPEMQDAAGEAWAPMVAERRADVETAAAALGRVRTSGRTATTADAWNAATIAQKRDLLTAAFDAFVFCPLPERGRREIVVFLAGEAPGIGRKRPGVPRLAPIDVPNGARVLLLEDARESEE